MSAPERDRLASAIARALEPIAEAQAALLFGSRATGRARADSDIDVAILLDSATGHCDAGNRLRTMIDALAKELAADRLDVVLLNEAPPALAFQVLKHGIVAFNRDPIALHRFRVRTYGLHADYAPVERFFRERTRLRLSGSESGG